MKRISYQSSLRGAKRRSNLRTEIASPSGLAMTVNTFSGRLRMTASLTLLIVVCGLIGPLSAQEEVSAPPFKLEDLLASARQRNPDIIAAKAEWIAAQKRVTIESSLPDPMGGYDIMGSMVETRVGPEQNRFMISQEVPFPTKLWQKRKMAQDESRAAFERYRAVKRDVANDLRKLYYELYFLDSSLQTIDEIKDLLKRLEGVAQARYSNLAGGQRDVAKSQAEVSMSLEKSFTLNQEREAAIAKINSLLDNDPMTTLGKTVLPAKPELHLTLEELVNLAVQNREEVKEMEALVSKSRHAKKLAKQSWLPDVTAGFEYVQVGSGMTTDPDDGQNSWMFPLRFTIPLWPQKNIAQIQEAQQQIEANQAKLSAAKNTAFYEIKDAYYRLDTALKLIELYETAVIPQAKLALTSDQAGYEAGESDFLNLLDSERVYLNAKLTQIRLTTEALKSHADLVRSAGLDLEASEPADRKEGK